jgi:hypothetical protein
MNPSLQTRGPAPRRNSVVAAVLLTVLTLGFYVPTWFIRRRRWLDRNGCATFSEQWTAMTETTPAA